MTASFNGGILEFTTGNGFLERLKIFFKAVRGGTESFGDSPNAYNSPFIPVKPLVFPVYLSQTYPVVNLAIFP